MSEIPSLEDSPCFRIYPSTDTLFTEIAEPSIELASILTLKDVEERTSFITKSPIFRFEEFMTLNLFPTLNP